MRLSRGGWNNVIIFAVMGFILMINMTNNKLFDEELSEPSTSQYIIGQEQVILSLMIDQKFTVERAGVSWRVTPQSVLNQQLAEQMMRAWHNTQGQVISVDADPVQSPLIISYMVAGKQNIHMISVYPQSDMLLVRNHQTNQYLAVAPQLYRQLIPSQLIP